MNLADLEDAAFDIQIAAGMQLPFENVLRGRGGRVDTRAVRRLWDDGQFYVLLDLKRAEHHATQALQKLDSQTEYLRQELEQHLAGVQVLLQKIEREEHLRRDRDVLLSPVPLEGLGETFGEGQ